MYESDIDTMMTLIRFDSTSGIPLGVLTFFPVHGTSMNNTNELVSGDNKGYAAYLMERSLSSKENQFVAGFMNSNLGDVSPNIDGAKCLDTGLPCDLITSTCDGRNELCVARGPVSTDVSAPNLCETHMNITQRVGRLETLSQRVLLADVSFKPHPKYFKTQLFQSTCVQNHPSLRLFAFLILDSVQ